MENGSITFYKSPTSKKPIGTNNQIQHELLHRAEFLPTKM